MNYPDISDVTFTKDEAREQLEGLEVSSSIEKVSDLSIAYSDDAGPILSGSSFEALPLTTRAAGGNLRYLLGVDTRVLPEYSDDTELLTNLFQHSLQKRSDKSLLVVRTGEGISDIHGEDYPWLSPLDVFDKTAEEVGDRLVGVEKVAVTKKGVEMRLVTNKAEHPPKRVGEYSHTGVWVHANGIIETGSFVYTLVCTNGMLSDWRQHKALTRSAYVDSLQDGVRKSLNEADSRLHAFMALDEQKVDDPAALITALTRQTGTSDRATMRILEAASSLPDEPTGYDVVNLITSRAHAHSDIQYE